MPAKGKKRKKGIQFKLDTLSFSEIWVNHNHKDKKWHLFCDALFIRFTKDIPDNASNRAQLDKYEAGWQKWDLDTRYAFISERAYSKCTGLQRRAVTAAKDDPSVGPLESDLMSLPDGYLDRPGAKTGRANITDIIKLFRAKKK